MQVSSAFDGGNIICHAADSPDDIRLSIDKDSNSSFFQWFYFRLTGAQGQDCRLKIVNAGEASYTAGWKDYQAVCSYDRKDWFRVATDFDGSNLTITHKPEQDAVYYAYFAPYSLERHADLVARTLVSPGWRHECLGRSVDGQDLDLLISGEAGANRPSLWIIARQHPGETMAEWLIEGLLERLCDQADPVARALRQKAQIFVVPNINPDGSKRGNLRTNAMGVNLNRAWAEPSANDSPEIYHLRARMVEAGCDFFLDVHGDEGLPYNFVSDALDIPSVSERQKSLTEAYCNALKTANPDFQTEHGYPAVQPGQANLTIAANNVAETFGCLAMTLEQPFKDSAITPDPRHGWSPERAKRLGAANLTALFAVFDDLR